MSSDIPTSNRTGVGTSIGSNNNSSSNPSTRTSAPSGPQSTLGSRAGTPRTMPDGTRQVERHHSDSNSSIGQRPPPGFPAASANKAPPPGLSRDSTASSQSFNMHSSPPSSHQSSNESFALGSALPAPRAMPPFQRVTSPQLGEQAAASTARSPSPTKRGFNFPIGDASERWNSIGQSQAQGQGQAVGVRSALPRKQSTQSSGGSGPSGIAPGGAFSNEPFLGYNELFSPTSAHGSESVASKAGASTSALSTSDPMNPVFPGSSGTGSRALSIPSHHEVDPYPPRFDLGGPPFPGGPGLREDPGFPGQNGAPGSRSADDFAARQAFGMAQGMPSIPGGGNISPRSLLHYHHQQLQAQQAMAMQAAQHGIQAGPGNVGPGGPGQPPSEEITTVFIVGFPDDMTEREFANMFLFAKGFEASTLKIPAGVGQVGPGGRGSEGGGPLAGPGGPYQAVNMPGAGLFDLPNGSGNAWDDHGLSLALSRAGASDTFSSLANMGGISNALSGMGGPNQAGANAANAGGKIKQIIGFAKFRTRTEALEARDALNGRKIDADKGCVLKTEMAKKNLHTKQRPVLSGTGGPEGNPAFGGPGGPPPSAGPNQPPQPPFAMGPFDREGLPFNPRDAPSLPGGGPPSAGPFGSFPPGKAPSTFEPFKQPGNAAPGGPRPNGVLSPPEPFGSDFYGPGVGPAQASGIFGGPKSGPPGPDSSGRAPQPSADSWTNSMGPLDYFGPDTTQQGQRTGGPTSGPNQQQQQSHQPSAVPRLEWGSVGSPPGLYGMNAGPMPNGIRPGFARQASRGPGSGQASDVAGTPSAQSKPDEAGRVESSSGSRAGSSPPQAGFEGADVQQQQGAVAARFGNLRLGSPTKESGDGPAPAPVRGPGQIPSPDLPSPTGRGFVGDNHPPGNTLFVGNLPSSASSTLLAQIEDQLRVLFASCRGFRQFSFRLKSNGPMCFVEFEDVQCASSAMAELNGNTLSGAIKNGGIRLSFSKNPLFRMNSNSAMNAGVNAHMSLGHASESLVSKKAEN